MSHTPEPWNYERGDWHSATDHIIRSKETEAVAVRMKGSDIYDVKASHDCARIVTCVNALSGIPDPAEYRRRADAAIERCQTEDAFQATFSRTSGVLLGEQIELDRKRNEALAAYHAITAKGST